MTGGFGAFWLLINIYHIIPDSNIIALEALLQTKSEKDLLDMRSEGVEPIYWAGTGSGLMEIYNFPGDSSKGRTGMGAGFYRHDNKGGGCCRVGGGVGGGLSGRAKFAAACLALEDSFTHDPHGFQRIHDGSLELSWKGQGPPPVTFPDGSPISSRFFTRGSVWASSPCLLKSEHIGASFSTDVERISTTYDGMGLAYNLLSRGLRQESNTGAP